MKKQWTSSLIVDAGSPAVRIEVLDSNFEVRARGYNRIQQTLPTGIYKVRYQAGDATVERLVQMPPDKTVRLLDPPKLEFGSAAPMAETHTSHEYHQFHANELSRAKPLARGSGAELFLFVRDLEPGGRGHPMQGMSLHTLWGEKLVDLVKDSRRSEERTEALWAGCTISLDPGSYLLRLNKRNGPTVDMMVMACPNWQNQLFLLRNNRAQQGRTEPLDISNATQLMARLGKGFDPSVLAGKRPNLNQAADDIRLVELAQQAVVNQWRGFHARDLNQMLRGKFSDPMLGILGLHLLLMRPDLSERDLRSAAHIHRRLQEDVLDGFPHPDVQALGIEIAQLQGKRIPPEPIRSLTMLRRSWSLLLKASVQQPSILPADSFLSQIADRIWGNGAWLAWSIPDAKQRRGWDQPKWTLSWQRSESAIDVNQVPTSADSLSSGSSFEALRTSMLDLLPSLEPLIEQYKDPEKLAKKARLSTDEFTLLMYLHTGLQFASLKASPTSTSGLLDLETLVRSLGIPAERIVMMIIGLRDKLRPLVKPRR